MSEFKAGFARIDITPPVGTNLVGYYHPRKSDGILDPLLATAVAFSDGINTNIIMSCDLIGIDQETADDIRQMIEDEIGVKKEGIMITCVHTHLGFGSAKSYACYCDEVMIPFKKKLVGLAKMAVDDLKEATMYTNSGFTPVPVTFIRLFRMKDGSAITNPGILNPEIDHPIGDADHRVALTYFVRENAPEIAMINFQVHADVIGGNKISADYPKFVRDTYEKAIPNSLCMYINGPEGDSNHIDVTTPEGMLRGGYEFSKHMGRTIAGTAISLRAMARETIATPVKALQINIDVEHNKATSKEELEKAEFVYKLYKEGRWDEVPVEGLDSGGARQAVVAESCRIVQLKDVPDTKNLHILGLCAGEFAIIGFPGEPFTEIGLKTRENSKFQMTFGACCANGFEGYYPSDIAYEVGGYEAKAAKYRRGISDKLVDTATNILDKLHE